jgi:peptidoglycan/LPS O-acetylase OafA/YrhL
MILGAVLAFIVLPLLIYTGLKKMVNPVPFWLLVLLALLPILAFITISLIHPPKDPGIIFTIVGVLLFFILNALIVILPFHLFEKHMDPAFSSYVLGFAGFTELFCWASAILLQYDMKIGDPWTHVSTRLPFFIGWVMDSVFRAIHAEDFVYSYNSTVYSYVVSVGLFLEVILVVGALCAVSCYFFPAGKPDS